MTEHDQIAVDATLGREYVARMARRQQTEPGRLPPAAAGDWVAALEAISPTPADTQSHASPSKAIRETGIQSDLASTVRRLFAEDAALTNREVLTRVNAGLPTRADGRPSPLITEHQVNRVLHRLRQRGEIERIKQGVHQATPKLRKE